jgi:hypothetical protein
MPADLTTGTRITSLQAGVRLALTVIGPDLRGDSVDAAPRPVNPGSIAVLCLTVAAALLLVVAGHGAGRRGDGMAALLFWSGIALLVVPISLRIGWPLVARGERFFLLFLLVEALFFYKVIYSPTSFIHYDEFLHWVAADDLMTAHRLFLFNPLLEVGATYLGLEILTTAIANLTGLPLFAAGTLLLAVLRGTFIAALFLFYERITGSARISAIACLAYMGCSTFALFESMYSYESLGIVLCMLAFAVEAASRDLVGRPRLKAVALIALLLASIAVTHHLSAAYAAIYFGALATFETLRRGGPRSEARIAAALAILAVALPLLWIEVRGTHLTAYLGPVVQTGVETLLGKLQNILATQRPIAIDAPAPPQPFGMRLTTLLGVLLLALGLATGFFRSLAMAAASGARAGWRPIRDILKRRWRDSRIVFLTLFAFGLPVSVAFRLTTAGWEIGNRMGTLAFFGVGLVVAVGIVHFWQGRTPRGWRRIAPALALAVIVLSGITTASIDPIHGRYRPSADGQSVESMGIETSLWTKAWLGAGNRFTSDRINRLLLAGYGRQDVRFRIVEGVEPTRVFETQKLGLDEFYALVRSDIDFLLVDLRLSAAPPVLGFYFAPSDAWTGKPLSAAALLKFNDVDGITRVYDNGFIVIYDVRGLHERS